MLNLHNLGDILVHLDDLPRAYGAIRQSLALCEEFGYERLANYNRMFLAFLDGIQGDGRRREAPAPGHRVRREQGLHVGRHRRARAAREAPASRRAARRRRATSTRRRARSRRRGAPPRRRRLRPGPAEARADEPGPVVTPGAAVGLVRSLETQPLPLHTAAPGPGPAGRRGRPRLRQQLDQGRRSRDGLLAQQRLQQPPRLRLRPVPRGLRADARLPVRTDVRRQRHRQRVHVAERERVHRRGDVHD